MPSTRQTDPIKLAEEIRTAIYDLDERDLRATFLEDLRPHLTKLDDDESREVRLAIARGIARASIVYADVAVDVVSGRHDPEGTR